MILTCDRHEGFIVSYEALSHAKECPLCSDPPVEPVDDKRRLQELRSAIHHCIRELEDCL